MSQLIVAELERRSGLPVQVAGVADLGVMARITTSPDATGSYIIQYRNGLGFTDYLVAFQCAHILRLLSLPPGERYQFATNAATLSWGSDLVSKFFERSRIPRPPGQALAGFAEQLIAGLFTQLRSIPIGMRIDAWLADEYPGLVGEQAEALAAQQQESLSCLSPQVRSMVPDEIVSAGIVLNAAHALFCDRLLGITRYHVPYAASGFADLSRGLLKTFDDLPADPASDRTLVDAWAGEIGLSDKYAWVPFSSPATKIS